MTLQTLHESGMDFFCDSRDTFFVEKYVKESGIQHVKTVEIVQKAIDGFSILLTVITSRRQAELGESIASADYTKTCFCLVLVIKNHEKAWLSPIQDMLRNTLYHFSTAWNWGSQPILVLNEEMAVNERIIMSPQGGSGPLDLNTIAASKNHLKDPMVSVPERRDRRWIQSLTSLPPHVAASVKRHGGWLSARPGDWRVKALRRQ